VTGTPLSFLQGFGTKADTILSLTWGLLIISIVVVVIIAGLVLAGILVQRSRIEPAADAPLSIRDGGPGWIALGIGITSIVLIGSVVWTVMTLAAVNGPPSGPALTIEVTGNQWWWKVRYLSDNAARVFTTANEIHIPVGQPVRVRLIGADVIHSFWVPALTGKTDTIPGQINVTWIEANQPGRYEGQCTQYCGVEHSRMQFYVVAEPPAQFRDWWEAQLKPAAAPQSAAAARGEQLFVFHCGSCHAVRGTPAGGTVAPDLTDLMSRGTIAAGALPNNVADLSGWIANPQGIKPGTLMPTLYLSGPDLNDIRSYLVTLN
jgi:cytochrome c oxidase subunit II